MNPDSLLQLMRDRLSVRRYASRRVGPEDIARILEAARVSPSSCNTQPWHIIVVDRPELVAELSLCAPVGTRINRWLETAPLVFVLCGAPHPLVHRAAGWIGHDCHRLDVGIAGQQMCLMACALGLGSCWIGWFAEGKIRRLLDVPDSLNILALLAVGYPAGEPAGEGPDEEDAGEFQKKRKTLAEITSFNRYGQMGDGGGRE